MFRIWRHGVKWQCLLYGDSPSRNKVGQMQKSFLPDNSERPMVGVFPEPTSNREFVKFLLIGSRQGVTNQIHSLYCKGVAQVDEWSPLQPTAKAGEFVSILSRQISLR